MKKVGIISDTHGFWDDRYEHYMGELDEIWHAGDIGSTELAERFEAMKPHFRAVCGSVACSEPDTFISWLKKYGGEKIVLGADVKDGFVAVNGWLEKTGMKADDLLSAFIPEGLRTVIVTDISKDGMLSGPAVQLYVDLLCAFPSVQVIASGGVGSMSDIEALEEAGVPAVIVGKAIYEGRIAIEALGRFSDGL